MITKKIIISIILLLTYSLGFAHNFIPHQHDSQTETHSHAHEDDHEHHPHNSVVDSDHEHISHGDHFDEGLYDLLVCFLHDADFHNDDCNNHYFISTKSNNSLTNKSQQLALVATLLALTIEFDQPRSTTNIVVDQATSYRSPSIADSPLRGPPVLS